jgi:hypothetical protein
MSLFNGFQRLAFLFPKGKKKRPRRARATGRTASSRWQSRLSFETLERREVMATVPINFGVPSDLPAGGVYASAFATLTADYQQQNGGSLLTSGSYVYFDSTLNNGDGDYALATGGTNYTFQLDVTLGAASFDLPDTFVKAGQIVIGVASAPNISFNPSSGFATPTVSTNPGKYFGLFEYAIDGAGWNIDLSLVEQLGFPFTIDTTPAPNTPVLNGVGIMQNRADLFHLYGQYIADVTKTVPSAAAFQRSIALGEPYGVLSPHLLFNNNVPTAYAPTPNSGGGLSPNTMYYYWVTATNASGETAPSIFQNYQTYDGNNSANLTWSSVPGATGYRVYRSLTNDPSTATRLLTTSKLYYLDSGAAGTAGIPPTNNYSFDPFNTYFNLDINEFFAHYQWNGSPSNSNEFSITAEFNGNYSTFTGYVYTNYQVGGTGPAYTALVLSSPDYMQGPPNQAQMQQFVILRPYFSNNTSSTTLPAAPNWVTNPQLSPAAMIFANDGVFKTSQPDVDAVALNGLQNSVVSAFNRGIATDFSVAPSDWANAPKVYSAQAINGGSLTPSTNYYYVVTAQTAFGETTVSTEFKATTTSTNRRVQLAWEPQDVPGPGNELGYTSYNVYRRTDTTGYERINWPITNWHANNLTGFIDNGAMPLVADIPVTYYPASSTSNWYAAFQHQNYSTNPTSGISIDGLAYGFAYDDQGAQSSDLTAVNPTQINITLLPWSRQQATPPRLNSPPTSPTSLQFLTQPVSAKLTAATSVSFKVLTAQGHTFMGGTRVTVEVQGPKKMTFYVDTDALTGVGSFNFNTSEGGYYRVKLTLDNGTIFHSQEFMKGTGKFIKKYF